MNREFELRSEPNGFSGTIVDYSDRASIRGVPERFMPGSVEFDDVILNLMHDRSQPVARTGTEYLTIDDSPRALTLSAKYPDTVYGNRARELVEAGVLRGLSAEFVAVEERMQAGTRIIDKAKLYGVGIVDRPAYQQSMILRDWSVGLEYRQGDAIEAFIPYNIPFIVSLANRRKVMIDGELELADVIFLLDGYDYNRALASTGAGTLTVNQTPRGLGFHAYVRDLRRAPDWPNVRKRMRAGLVNGVTPGLMRTSFREILDKEGFKVTIVEAGGICEINTIARTGAGKINRSRGRRRRWLY